MSLVTLAHARRSTYPASAKLHGGSLALAGGRRMKGGSWWSNIGDKIKGAFNSANNWLKKTKIISKVANVIPHPYAKGVGTVAGMLGYGRYHNRVRGYRRKTGAVRKYTRRVPRKRCMCGSGRGCGCR